LKKVAAIFDKLTDLNDQFGKIIAKKIYLTVVFDRECAKCSAGYVLLAAYRGYFLNIDC
jgi:hypothetical protein